jgi:hypothetical protein
MFFFFVMTRSTWSITVKLPLCPLCAPAAERVAPGPTDKIALWVLWQIVLLMCVGLLSVATGTRIPFAGVGALGGAVLAGIGLWVWYSMRRPRGNQSSFYQQVRLLRVKRAFLCKDAGILLGFTNQPYADKFIAANPSLKGAD